MTNQLLFRRGFSLITEKELLSISSPKLQVSKFKTSVKIAGPVLPTPTYKWPLGDSQSI